MKKKVAILIENLFDEQELIYPYHRLREEFDVVLVGTEADTVYSSKAGYAHKSDVASRDINPADFAGVFIPGGFSPDMMRRSEATIAFVRAMDEADKPIAAICHGGWMLASAADIKGKDVTCFFSIIDDLVHAGANYVDKELVISGNILTSRTPKDLPALLPAFVEAVKG